MAQSLTHDVLILGAGLAGLRAAVEISSPPRGPRRHRHRVEGAADARPLGVRRGRHRRGAAHRGRRLARPARLGHRQGVRLPRRPGRRATASSAPSPTRSCSSTTGAFPGRATSTAASRSARSAATPSRARRWRPTRPASSRCRRCTTSCCATRRFTRYDEFFVTDILVPRTGASPACSGSTRRAARRWCCAARRCSSPPAAAARSTASRPTPRR